MPAPTDNCQLRMDKEGEIIIPRHRSGQRLDEAGGSSTVFVQYSLGSEGRPKDIQTYTEVSACAHFENSAQKALLRSTFSGGLEETGCRHEYTITFEP